MKKIFHTSTPGENIIANNSLLDDSFMIAFKRLNQNGKLRKLILAGFVFFLFIFHAGAAVPKYTITLTPSSLNFPGLSGGSQIVTITTSIPLDCMNFSFTGCVTHVTLSGNALTVYCGNNGLPTALTGSVTVWDDCLYYQTATVDISQDAGYVIPRSANTNMNYIRSRTILKDYTFLESSVEALSSDEVQETITYLDGMGRPRQTLLWQASPAKYDIILPVSYDVLGREDKKYLPYALTTGNNGAFVANDTTDQKTYYSGMYGATDGIKAFAKTGFEASPLNRVLRQGAPGSVWQPNPTPSIDHSVKLAYDTNIASEVKRWKVVNDVLTDDGVYAASMLYKTITWDENNDQTSGTSSHTEEFKDLLGKVVLKVATDGNMKHYTYYVYDDLGLLRFVLTPKALEDNMISGTELDDLCCQYRYDPRNRMIRKKLPGAGWTSMVYDLRDRLVATQDSVMSSSGRWLVTKYDQLNRPVMTASKVLSDSRSTLQSYIDAYPSTSSYYETPDASTVGYTLNSFGAKLTLSESELLTVTYYDNYTYPGAKAFDTTVRLGYSYYSGAGYYYFDGIKGLVTGTKVKVLDGTENNSSGFRWLVSTNYYDDRYRVIQTLRDIYTPDATYYEATSVLYDFPGKVKQTKQAQTVNSVTTMVDKFYTYDHAGRLSKTEQQIAGDANGKVTVAQNIYNETGQLIDKKLHKAGSYDYLQSVDYTYNIRGWLTTINNPDNLSALQSGDPNIDLFGEKLLYEATESGLNSSYAPLFNGNISAMVWNSTQKSKQGYGFTYDGLNRLTLGDHKDYTSAWTDNINYEEKSLAYDKNGNINRLIRTNSTGSNIADFTYTYSGNKLSNINGGTAYNYDLNGNTTLDGLRVVSIAYNILNLPKLVSKGADNISYIYSAEGEKLAKKMKDNTYQYYAGNMVYKNDKSLNYLLFDEGLVTKTSAVYSYEYHLKDHLGNTRVTFQPNGNTTTTTQVAEYYPFGSGYLPVSPSGTNKYLYNGKEKQDDVLGSTALDWYDYGARFYDPMIGRWHSIDPLAEVSRRWSPYNYCVNNTMRFVDPDGMLINDFKLKQDGKIEFVKTTKSIKDELYATKNDGSINKEKSVSVKRGTFDNSISSNDGKTNGIKTNSVDDAKKVFKFASENSTFGNGSTPIEYALIPFKKSGIEQAVVVTDGDESSVSGSRFANELANDGAEIDYVMHNHPRGSHPSGYATTGIPDGTDGDYQGTNTKIGGKDIRRFVYSSQKNTVYEYDKQSTVGTPSVFYFGL